MKVTEASTIGKMPGRPNILFIMADDHAAKAISAYGHGLNHTPHLDSIAQNGMLFNHCYVTNSICTPSRATILTGVHNHINMVQTLESAIDNNLPNVAKQLRTYGDYQTAIIGKWHLGEGKSHEPSGFDYWEVIPGQGVYFDPDFITPKGRHIEKGYVTDLITDKTINFIEQRDKDRPFFVMCHHKAPHREWVCHPKHAHLYSDPIKVPTTYDDDYANRAAAAGAASNKVKVNMTYEDLGLSQPEGGESVGFCQSEDWGVAGGLKQVPFPDDDHLKGLVLVDRNTGERFTFKSQKELAEFKYQRYMQRYLRTIQSVDDSVGRLLETLDKEGLTDNTMVIYTSDQGFFLGDHGWFDKRFIYEESFQMPFLIQGPGIKPGSVCNDIISNVDFAATWLDFAGIPQPSYMQGETFLPMLRGVSPPQDEWAVAYHRYWMHGDIPHNIYAHYGVRSKRYKLIFWYNLGYDLPGTRTGGETQEWELFDCQADPMELFNIWAKEEYTDIAEKMLRVLERKMANIGDIAAHPVGKNIQAIRKLYPGPEQVSRGAAAVGKSKQHNLDHHD
ncbi:arylsulfatase A [Kockovaella imperatae]|uniref:Arylsulfatase A n=1 Tax=Kockovaella imperatae TaxID=4999 RepID=A0A1Y1UP75_9TREE|nr:arylsulfatase A [Kockovaella imperatae]ORX39831.1 arylsulfatase A [Kockovaella imperatae]